MWVNLSEEDLQKIIEVNTVAILATKNLVTVTPLLDRIDRQKIEQASANHVKYREAVETRDGDIESDDDAIVSIGEDPGAYVMVWRWVYNEDAGIESPEDEGLLSDIAASLLSDEAKS